MKRRLLTIQESESPYAIKHRGLSSKPQLTLKGNWLEQAGFVANTHVIVEVVDGMLIVRPCTSEEETT